MNKLRQNFLRGGWGSLALLAAAIALLYTLGLPGNHSEAEDAFLYSARVEHGDLPTLLHGQHLLYLPVGRFLYRLGQMAGVTLRGHGLLTAWSLLSGALAVALFVRLSIRRLSIPAPAAWLGALGLAASYGFWRYACEAEIYLPVAAIALLLFCVGLDPRPGIRRGIMAGALAAAGLLLHLLAALPAAAVGVVFLPQRRVLAAYLLTAGLLLSLAYGAAFHMSPAISTQISAGAPNRTPWRIDLANGTIGLGQALVSGNFLFGSDQSCRFLQNRFPNRALQEERYGATHCGPIPLRCAPFTLAALVAVAAATLWLRLRRRNGACARSVPTTGAQNEPTAPRRFTLAIGLWALLHGLVILWTEPANPELWVLLLIPLWLLVTFTVWAPLHAQGCLRAAAAVVGLLAIHNLVGGWLVVVSQDSDYNWAKSRWLLSQARASDTIVTAERSVFTRYLRYHTPARVVSLRDSDIPPPESSPWGLPARGAVFATADALDAAVLSMPPLRPDEKRRIEQFRLDCGATFHRITTDEFGGIFQREGSAPALP